ncbi:hypothetical protein CAP31_07200 [Sulfuriferula sp. AH1]|nr:hypothetical protein CAP31_07200 [Sulfuriferula sp. AH1]
MEKRVILVSVPKAGTYLMSQVLSRIGFTDTHLHVRYDDQAIGIYDFRNAPKKMSMSEQEQRFQTMPLGDSLAKIQSGKFALGHLPPIPEVKRHLCNDIKIIFLVQDLRDCLISHMRYMISVGVITEQAHPWCKITDERERFKQYLLNYAEKVGPLVHMKLIACWEYDIHNPCQGMEIFKLRFEDLIGANQTMTGMVIKSLAKFLEIEAPQDVKAMLKSVMGAETLTKSDGVTIRQRYWSHFAEQWFTERIHDLQGNNVNEIIGYP